VLWRETRSRSAGAYVGDPDRLSGVHRHPQRLSQYGAATFTVRTVDLNHADDLGEVATVRLPQ
jgi:hypothetical protein